MDLSDPAVDADMAKRARVRSLDTKWRLPYDLVCAIILKLFAGIVSISTDFFRIGLTSGREE